MSVESLLESIETSALGTWMRDTLPAMQIVEATHVLAAVVVLGTVLIVDLRLLGLTDSSRGFTRISRETLPLTWIAFAIAAVTGSLMFTTSAEVYFANPAFRLKAVALLAAGLNMALFQLVTARGPHHGLALGAALGGRRSARPLDRVHEGLRLHDSARRRSHDRRRTDVKRR
jgi:hypothetical protein